MSEAPADRIHRYAQAFRDAPIGMAIVATDERILEANHALCQMLGYTQQELMQRTVVDITHPDDLLIEVEHKEAAHSHRGGSFQVRKRYVRADGSILIGRLSVSTAFASDGSPAFFIGQLEDVTEQLRLQDQLAQLRRLDSLGQLAGGIAHDFNNMLAVILGFSELLRDSIDDTDAHADIDEILRAAERARGLIRQLLTVGQRGPIGPDVTDINQSVRDTTRMLARILDGGVQLQLELGDGVGAARIDTIHLEQILLNLATNARDAMPDGGSLRIATALVRIDRPRPGLEPGEYVRLDIQDSGAGMDEVTAAHLFEPFFTTKAPGQGTGLGLATVYGIVRQTAGHIQVDSTPGAGTTFSIWLPASDASPSPAAPSPARASGRSARVLLVEDEPAIRALCNRLLSRAGYEVSLATGGAEALRHAAERGPLDLLITDINMPGMSGLRLVELLHTAQPDLPVLYISGHAQGAMVTGGEGAHVGFLSKPFRADELLQRVRSLIGRDQ